MDKEEIREKALEGTKEQLREGDRDQLVVKAAQFLDQNNESFKSEVERFRDWYALHFPELEKEIGDDEQLIKILSKGIEKDELEAFSEMAEDSTGMPLKDEDRELLEKVHASLQDKLEVREELENYIEEAAEEEMPNLETLLGPLLATKLMAMAGGLEELAKKPSSTIQVLGAEKALFRYLHGEGTPPKHGVIFEHEFVNSLPEEKRGKIARFLANKAAIAARVDQYDGDFKGEKLREECQQKFDELKK